MLRISISVTRRGIRWYENRTALNYMMLTKFIYIYTYYIHKDKYKKLTKYRRNIHIYIHYTRHAQCEAEYRLHGEALWIAPNVTNLLHAVTHAHTTPHTQTHTHILCILRMR